MIKKLFKIKIILFFLVLIISSFFIFKINSLSNIDNDNKFAWGDYLGWVNFNPTNGNVFVENNKISGYAWSQNYGWINLSPQNSGVLNNGNGDLSGYAWGENIGWINFENVSIDQNGIFHGLATTENKGSINFDCANCLVKTNWDNGILSVGFFDENNNPSTSPIFNMNNASYSSILQTVEGYLGDQNNKIKITNTTRNKLWTMSISPELGSNALWIDSSNNNSYKFNGTNLEGNMKIDPATMNISNGNGILINGESSFQNGVVDSITLVSSNNLTTENYWDIENIKIQQSIPPNQPSGNYSINMVLSIISN